MQDLSSQIMSIIVPALTTAVGLLVTWGLAKLRGYLKAKGMSQSANFAYDSVSQLVQTAVVSLNQTMRKTMTDGQLSESEKRQLKSAAIDMVNKQLPEAIRKIMDRNVNDLDDFIKQRIEETVNYQKLRRA
jgi:hypothetical protein